jgi:hypothetical protein
MEDEERERVCEMMMTVSRALSMAAEALKKFSRDLREPQKDDRGPVTKAQAQ